MNQRIKKLWIEALRSGEFQQGKGYLEKNGKYCALGVLSALALIEGHCTYFEENGIARFDNRCFHLSYNVMKWAGIAQEDERYLNEDEHEVLIRYEGKLTSIGRLNDEGVGFKQLARLIQKFMG